jgi:hypothetical protein
VIEKGMAGKQIATNGKKRKGDQNMTDKSLEDLERLKTQKEIEKLEAETRSLGPAQLRGWLTSLSVIAAVLVSTIGIYKTLTEVRLNNEQLRIEAQIRSQEIFLNHILDRIAGIKLDIEEKRNNRVVFERTEKYGGTTMVGAQAAAVALANAFPNLCLSAQEALKFQAEKANDQHAKDLLEKLPDCSLSTPN